MAGPFTDRVVRIVKSIPSGRVVTYGQVAVMAGEPRGSRQVVRVLNTHSEKENLPWHRVINSQGRISLSGEGGRLQRRMLEAEGVEFDDTGATDLYRFQWRPQAGPGPNRPG